MAPIAAIGRNQAGQEGSILNSYGVQSKRIQSQRLRVLGAICDVCTGNLILDGRTRVVNEKRYTPIRVRAATMLGDERAADIYADLAWSRLNNDIWQREGSLLGSLNRSFNDSPE